MKGSEDERALTDRILRAMNEEADEPKDTLACQRVFVLHSETALQLREALRVGSGINPDDSILLRDYLRLFASFVPTESIEPKVHNLIEKAWAKLRNDPDTAVKEMEELAESFAHPENYRELLRFYQVRNVSGTLTLRRAQRLWDLTRDSSDQILWQAVARSFEPQPPWRRENQWHPNLEFVRGVWRDGGGKDPGFGMKLADAYDYEDDESLAADVLLEVIKSSEPTPPVVARCIGLLDIAKRTEEAEVLIQQLKATFVGVPDFATAWARHALRAKNKSAFPELTKSPWVEKVRPALRALLYLTVGLTQEAAAAVEPALRDIQEGEFARWELDELAKYFQTIERWEDFEAVLAHRYHPDMIREIKERVGFRQRRK